jgi:hypothetical protein
MRRVSSFLLCGSLFTPLHGFAAGEMLDPMIRSEIERVCGFCHFSDFFDQESEQFLEKKFLAKGDEIIRRLSLPDGHQDRMPPSRHPLQLKDGVAEDMIANIRQNLP